MRGVSAVLVAAAACAAAGALAPGPVTQEWIAKQRGYTSAEGLDSHHELAVIDPAGLSTALDASVANVTSNTATYSDGSRITVTLKVASATSIPHGWVGVYGSQDDVAVTVPMRYAVACQGDCASTTQHMDFVMPNMRQALKFVFFDCTRSFTVWPHGCVAVSESAPVAVDNPNAPLKIRVAPTGVAGQLRVQWSTATVAPGLFAAWGTTPTAHTNRALDVRSTSYTADDMCAPPATTSGYRDPGMIHSALLAGLPAGQTVYYIVGDDQTTSQSIALSVPPAVAADSDTRLTVYADMGRGTVDDSFTWFHYGKDSLNTTAYVSADIEAGKVHAIAHFGDLGYAQGFASVWDDWLHQVTPLTSRVPYAVNTGNHESDAPDATFHAGMRPTFYAGRPTAGGDSGGECSVPTLRQFPMPRPAPTDPWWSWNMGNIHIVAISTEYNFTTGSDQYNWLAADLAGVDRTVTPWIVFGAHRPMYVSSDYVVGVTSDQVVASLLRDHVEPLLDAAGVDLAVYGHNHAMQRFCASKGHECLQRSVATSLVDPEGTTGTWNLYDHPPTTVHVLVGSAGAAFSNNEVSDPIPPYVEVQEYWFGYVNLHTPNATHMFATFRDVTSGAIRDKWAIAKAAPSAGGSGSGAATPGDKDGITPGEEGAFIALGLVLLAAVVIAGGMWATGRCVAPAPPADYSRMREGGSAGAGGDAPAPASSGEYGATARQA